MSAWIFRFTSLFCATIAEMELHRYPMDDRAFALAVDDLTAKGNQVAGHIQTFNGPAGRHCPDFREMMSLALSAGYVEYLSPSYTHFVPNLSPRGAKRIIEREVWSEEEARDLYEIIETHLRHCGIDVPAKSEVKP